MIISLDVQYSTCTFRYGSDFIKILKHVLLNLSLNPELKISFKNEYSAHTDVGPHSLCLRMLDSFAMLSCRMKI